MRHRSHIAFILLAAALFAAPQMAQDLSTLKGAVAARIRGEVMHAFLGLHSNGSAAATQTTRADFSLFACDSSRPEAQPARAAQSKTAEHSTPARRGESGPRSQTAMLTDPADKTNGLPPSAVAEELASLPRQLQTETRLAMLTPPGNGVEPPPALSYRFVSGDARVKAAPAVRDNLKELERHALFLQVRFERVVDAESIRRVAEEAAAVEGAKAKSKVQKVRRPARACGGNKELCPLAPVPVAALPSPHAPSQNSDGE